MLGEIVEISGEIIRCNGHNPENNLLNPNVANCYVIRDNDWVFVIDSGATTEMEQSIKESVKKLGDGAEKLILLNTHAHVDHISNNESVVNIEGFKKVEHYAHEKAKHGFKPFEHLWKQFNEIDKYYDVFEGPPPPWRMITRLMGIANREKSLRWLIRKILFRYEPINPSPETVTFLSRCNAEEIELGPTTVEDLKISGDAVSIDLGKMKVKGWKLGNAIIVHDAAHSEDHLLVLFPEKKLLITGDLTVPMFPTWAGESSSIRIIEFIKWCIELTCEGLVEVLCDSHNKEVYRGSDQIKTFLKTLITDHKAFEKILLSLMEKGKGYTVNQLYKKLRKISFENELVDKYLQMQFPKTPVFLKTVIAGILLEKSSRIEGSGKKACFFVD